MVFSNEKTPNFRPACNHDPARCTSSSLFALQMIFMLFELFLRGARVFFRLSRSFRDFAVQIGLVLARFALLLGHSISRVWDRQAGARKKESCGTGHTGSCDTKPKAWAGNIVKLLPDADAQAYFSSVIHGESLNDGCGNQRLSFKRQSSKSRLYNVIGKIHLLKGDRLSARHSAELPHSGRSRGDCHAFIHGLVSLKYACACSQKMLKRSSTVGYSEVSTRMPTNLACALCFNTYPARFAHKTFVHRLYRRDRASLDAVWRRKHPVLNVVAACWASFQIQAPFALFHWDLRKSEVHSMRL